MTIQNTNLRKAGPFQGNAVTTVFPFTFKVFSASEILVLYLDTAGTETTLALTTNYTVSLNADQNATPGGSVTLLAANATGTYITIASALTNTQNLTLTNAGGFYPQTINDALDRIVILVQQLAEKVSRAALIPISGIGSLANSNLVFGVDNSGNPILKTLASISSSVVSLFMSTFLAVPDAATARVSLGAAGATDVQTQSYTAVTTTGTSTVYVAAPTPSIATPTANTRLRLKFHLASGATPTLTVGSVTAALQQYSASGALVAATLALNQLTDVEYNGTVYVVLDPLGISQASGDIRYAALAGLNTQQFNVASASAADNAVAYGQVLGLGQAWTDVTGSRVIGTTYTNSTGRPIMVMLSSGTAGCYATVGGVRIMFGGANYDQPSFIVPVGATYVVTGNLNTTPNWVELR